MAHLQSLKKVKANISRLRKVASVVIILVLFGCVAVLGVYSYQLTKSKAAGGFDRAAAKKAGYSDQEIDEYLRQKEKLCRVYSNSQGKFIDVPCDETKTNEPSERALKAASYAYFSFDKKGQGELEQKMLATGSADLTIKNMALWLDTDMTKLIMVETLMQKKQQDTVTSYDTYGTQTSGSNSDSSLEDLKRKRQQQCQEEISRYTACLSEYNLKMNEYTSCQIEDSEWKYCSKPTNFCGIKPICFY